MVNIKGSKIHTKKGLVSIEEIIIGDDVLTSNGYKTVNKIFYIGKQKIINIKTNNGFIKCSKNHKLAIKNDNNFIWKPAEELKKGDFLLTTNIAIEGSDIKLPNVTNNSNRKDRITIPNFNSEISWLFGFFCGNGLILDNSVKIYAENLAFLDKVIKYFSYFGENIHTIVEKNKIDNIYSIELISQNLTKFFREYISNDISYFINETSLSNRIEYIKGVLSSKINNNYTITQPLNNKWIYSFHLLCYSCGFETKFIKLKESQRVVFENANVINIINGNKPNDTEKYILCNIEYLIEEDNKEYDIYDLSVLDNNEYYSNGYLCHNSFNK